MKIRDIEGIITGNTYMRIRFNQKPEVNWKGMFWEVPKRYKNELDIKKIDALTPFNILDDPVGIDIFVEQNTDEIPLLPRLSELRDYSGCSEAPKMAEVMSE